MEPHDPFGWIMEGCQISSSEESRLNRCSYFGQSDSDNSVSHSSRLNPPSIPVAQTGITMVSPPISTQEDQEIFRTPPESRSTSTSFHNCYDDPIIGDGLHPDGGTVVVDADSADSRMAVDLGRDTDLGFSEVQVDSAQRILIEANMNPDGTFRRELEETRVSKRRLSPKEQLSSESLSKRLNGLDLESPSKSLGAPKGRNTNELLKSLKKWNLKNVNLSPGAAEELELENQHNGEGSVRKRRLDLLSEIVGSDTEQRSIERENNNGETSNRGKSLDFLTEGIEYNTEERIIECDQVRCSGEKRSNSCGLEEKRERKRALPSWANNGRVEKKSDRKRALPSSVNNGRIRGDENVDKELEDDEMELLSSWSNGRVEEDDGRTAELEVSEMETIHLDTNSDNLSEGVKKTKLLDVLMKLEEDYEEDRSLVCLSVLEVAQRKWGACAFS